MNSYVLNFRNVFRTASFHALRVRGQNSQRNMWAIKEGVLLILPGLVPVLRFGGSACVENITHTHTHTHTDERIFRA